MPDLSNIINNTGSGAAAGSAFGPWGAVAGGSLGALSGVFGESAEERRKKALKDYQRAQSAATSAYVGDQGQILQGYDDLWSQEGVSAAKTSYTDSLAAANPGQYKVDQGAGAQTYTDAKDMASSYLDPSIAYQQESARKNIEESAAGQGGLYSGAAAREIARETADIGAKGWQQAFQNAAGEQTRANNVVTQTQQNAITAGNYNNDLDQQGIANKKDAYGAEREVMDLWAGGQSDLNRTKFDAATSANNLVLQGKLGNSGGQDMWGSVLNAASAGKTIKDMWGKK